MECELRDQAPRVRCYRCGSPDIASLCHHCVKPMCKEHSARAVDDARRPVSRELAGLELEDDQEAVYHCKDHVHVVRRARIIYLWAAAAVAPVVLIVLIVLPFVLSLPLAGVVTGAGAVTADRVRRNWAEAARASRPPLPLIPQLDAVSIVETLHGEVHLGDDGYTSTAGKVNGRMDFGMTLAKAGRDRLRLYRDKYRQASGQPVRFSAGYAVIEGEVGLSFSAENAELIRPGGTCLAFAGNPDGHPLFGAVDGRPEGEWRFGLSYDLMEARAPESIPLWIVPSLVPASDQRTLEIDLHWELLGEEGKESNLERFDLIELRVPPEWGNVEGVSPGDALTSPPRQGEPRSITWKQLPPSEDKDDEGRMSRTLTIRFEHQIVDRPSLEGSLRATFSGTLSGLTGIGFYLPGGGRLKPSPELKIKTEVSVDFSISLAAVRYQDDRVVPDRGNVDDVSRSEIDEFSEVIPDYRTVIELTNAISKEGYYVKRVIENPPRGAGRAGVVNRVWDIAGRWYEGVFPVDFHMTLTGEEEYQGAIRAHAGNTITRISVQGAYANPKMQTQIEAKWDELHRIVRKILQNRAPCVAEVIVEHPADESQPEQKPAASRPSDDERNTEERDDRAAALRQRRGAVVEAQRISVDMYRDVIARIDMELDSLDGGPA